MKYLLILLGGGAGSLARYVVGSAIASRFGTLPRRHDVGQCHGLLPDRVDHDAAYRAPAAAPVLAARAGGGFLGGYTTFSSFEWETYSAVREGGLWIGLANIVGSVTLGYAAVWLGALLARR